MLIDFRGAHSAAQAHSTPGNYVTYFIVFAFFVHCQENGLKPN